MESDADLDAFVRAKSDSAYHPSCTCKMGEDDMAVVSSSGKVADDDDIIMPSQPTLTTQACEDTFEGARVGGFAGG